ncbi:MAG: hypothetical protein K9G11_00725 [Rickettsiaceae bacterium]|nr:hypothetical protein [Rickettsiaceae bacterium]
MYVEELFILDCHVVSLQANRVIYYCSLQEGEILLQREPFARAKSAMTLARYR